MSVELPAFRASDLRKSYGPIEAVRGVSMSVDRGELVALVGDNGAGKSSVVKMISGAMKPDSGSLELDGRPVHFAGPRDAIDAGVNTVYQDLALVPNLDVVSNLFLGREDVRGRGPFLARRRMERRAREFLGSLEVNVPRITGQMIGTMSGGQRQAIAIARAAYWATSLLILDEPTAALGIRESQAVLRLVRHLRDQGVPVLMISHILPHITELADRIVVLRHGRVVANLDTHAQPIDTDRLVTLITGSIADVEAAVRG